MGRCLLIETGTINVHLCTINVQSMTETKPKSAPPPLVDESPERERRGSRRYDMYTVSELITVSKVLLLLQCVILICFNYNASTSGHKSLPSPPPPPPAADSACCSASRAAFANSSSSCCTSSINSFFVHVHCSNHSSWSAYQREQFKTFCLVCPLPFAFFSVRCFTTILSNALAASMTVGCDS